MINLKLDKKGGINKGDIVIFENDNKSDIYIIQLMDHNQNIDLTNKSVQFTMIDKETKKGDMINLTIFNAKEGKVKLEITKAISKKSGDYISQIKIIDGAGYEEGLFYFDITVNVDLITELSGEIIQNPSFEILNTSLAKVQEWDNYFKEVAPTLENKYTERLTTIDNKVNQNKTNFDNALQGNKVATNNNIFNRIPLVKSDGGMEVGNYIDFHILDGGNVDNNGRLSVNNEGFVFDKNVSIPVVGVKGIQLKTYADYGSEILTNILLDNRNNAGKLVVDNIKHFDIPNSKFTCKEIIADTGIGIWNGNFVDEGDEKKPYIGTRRNVQGWAFADKNGTWWDILAKNINTSSDQRVKIEIPTTKGITDLEKIKALAPRNFKFYDDNKTHYGFYAQELEKILPSAITTINFENEEKKPLDKNGNKMNDFKFINYNDIVTTLVGAVKELSLQVESLKSQIK